MRILRLVLSIGPTSAPYNQFTLPVVGEHDITLCTYFPGRCRADNRLEYYEGDGRLIRYLAGLWRLVRGREFDVVHIHAPHLGLMFLLVALFARPSLLSRTVMHLHSSYSVYRLRNRWMLLPAFLLFSRLMCCSQTSLASFPWFFRRLAGRRLKVICNGMDLERIDGLWQRPVPLDPEWDGEASAERGGPLRLVAVGHLRALKNQAAIIRALASAEAKDVSLTILGDGPLRRSLEQMAVECGVDDRVTFAGCLSRNETLTALWQADGLISMSRGEGLPVSVLEAMSCHCGVILSDIPAHREIRGQRPDLIPLVEVDDQESLGAAIDAWRAMPLDVRRSWGTDCRQHVETRYSMRRMLDELDDVFGEYDPAVSLEWEMLCRCLTHRRPRHRAA